MNVPIRKRYETDLSDAQWALILPLIVLPTGGSPRTTNLREVLNGIFYQLRTGCQWRLLPHDFPPEGTVRRYFHYFKRTKQWETINAHFCRAVRVQAGSKMVFTLENKLFLKVEKTGCTECCIRCF